jgi:hypothetical protein
MFQISEAYWLQSVETKGQVCSSKSQPKLAWGKRQGRESASLRTLPSCPTKPLFKRTSSSSSSLSLFSSSTSSFFFCFFETGSIYVAQACLELAIFLPWPLQSQDYRHVPPQLARIVSSIEKDFKLLDKHEKPTRHDNMYNQLGEA